MNTSLNDAQINVLQDIYSADPSFRELIQQRFQQEADSAASRAEQLKAITAPATSEEGSEGEAAPVTQPESREKAAQGHAGRPRSDSSANTKMGKLLAFLEKNPDSSIKDIAVGLKSQKMSNSMLNSYIYQLLSRKQVVAKGPKGARTYRVKKTA